jgi:hypothetical protein
MTRHPEREGFALAAAVCLLAALAAIAAASAFAVREARRSANRLARQEEAAALADSLVYDRLQSWHHRARDTLTVGATDSTPSSTSRTVYVSRVTNRVYAVTGMGRTAIGTIAEATRGHTLFVDALRPTVPVGAAMLSRGPVVVGTADISGRDEPPPEWQNCPPADSATAAGIAVPPDGRAEDEAGALLPDVAFQSAAGDPATYQKLGALTLATLASGADVVIGGGAVVSPGTAAEGTCGVGAGASRDSWGEPLRGTGAPRCERLFPVVHAAGDLVVRGGRGQGILIVDGRLRIEGPFLYYGAIVATAVEASGADVTVYGTVISSGDGGIDWRSGGTLRRSTCAVSRASSRAERPFPIPRRGWFEVP